MVDLQHDNQIAVIGVAPRVTIRRQFATGKELKVLHKFGITRKRKGARVGAKIRETIYFTQISTQNYNPNIMDAVVVPSEDQPIDIGELKPHPNSSLNVKEEEARNEHAISVLVSGCIVYTVRKSSRDEDSGSENFSEIKSCTLNSSQIAAGNGLWS